MSDDSSFGIWAAGTGNLSGDDARALVAGWGETQIKVPWVDRQDKRGQSMVGGPFPWRSWWRRKLHRHVGPSGLVQTTLRFRGNNDFVLEIRGRKVTGRRRKRWERRIGVWYQKDGDALFIHWGRFH
jgi:hypothetical protein